MLMMPPVMILTSLYGIVVVVVAADVAAAIRCHNFTNFYELLGGHMFFFSTRVVAFDNLRKSL